MGLCCLSSIASEGQGNNPFKELNGITLGISLEYWKNDIYLITGDEPAYEHAPELKKQIKKNISLGIRDGAYEGAFYRQFGPYQAQSIHLRFYKGTLFKVQWTFNNRIKLQEIFDFLSSDLIKKLGEPIRDAGKNYKRLEWNSEQHYVQLFLDIGFDITIEFADVSFNQIVEKATNENAGIH